MRLGFSMTISWLFSLFYLVCLGLLATDLAEAVPRRLPAADTIDEQGERCRVARRRKKSKKSKKPKRRRKKTRPKPAAEPEPAPAPETPPEGSGTAIPMGAGGRGRVDFEAQLIKGQTTKAGEVQILERKDAELKSMVRRRTSFRKEIILTVFPEKAGKLK